MARSIVGLDMKAAKEAFSDFSVLQESPFTDQGSLVDIFDDTTVWFSIRKVIDNINANAVA